MTLSESDDNSLLGTFGTSPGDPALDVPNYTQGISVHDPRSEATLRVRPARNPDGGTCSSFRRRGA